MQKSVGESSITVNGERMRTSAPTLAVLVETLGYDAASIATAVNGDFVPRAARAGRALAEGDAVEIVAPRQGG
jgi:sulfur carrier protein